MPAVRSCPISTITADDRWPSSLRLLLGSESSDLIEAFFGPSGGAVLDGRPRQVTHRPAGSSTVRYEVRVGWPDGSTTEETVVASIGRRIGDGAAVLRRDEIDVQMWRWPHDPALPGLAAALDRTKVRRLLADLGSGVGDVDLRVRAYRPGRRAVVEASNDRGRLFLKVVPPDRAQRLHENHRLLAPHLPVPDSIGWTDDGIVVLPGVGGATLRSVLRRGGASPAPAAIDGLLDRLPIELLDRSRRSTWSDAVRHHGRVINATVPSAASQVDGLLDQLEERRQRMNEHPLVPVHGDLHEAQLLVSGRRVVGLLDVDTAGVGHRVDDLANLCAHLSVLSIVTPSSAAIRSYGAQVLAFAEQAHDPHDLRVRIAAGVVGLSTGPFAVLERDLVSATRARLDLAERWIASADRSGRRT